MEARAEGTSNRLGRAGAGNAERSEGREEATEGVTDLPPTMRVQFRTSRGPDETADQAPHFLLAQQGERLAIEHLEQRGYRLVAANFSLPIGRNLRGVTVNAEIDVVAYDQETLCFVEVKTRASDDFVPPQVNVDLRKRRQVARAALAYRRMFGLVNESYRYDVVTVVAKPDGAAPRIELLKGFWSDAQLKKRKWQEHYWD